MKVTYSAVFLDAQSVRKLKDWWRNEVGPLHSKEFVHHMTIAFRPSVEDTKKLPIGEEVELRVVGYNEDEKGQAVLVDTPVPSNNAHPHITIATNGTSPVYSNELLASSVTRVRGPVLKGTVGFSDGRNDYFELPND